VVRTAWIVLASVNGRLEPGSANVGWSSYAHTIAESVPGHFLAEHGEGFFLLSLGVEDLAQTIEQLSSDGVKYTDTKVRAGILDWRVADIGIVHGALMQLTEDGSGDGN